MLQQFSSRRKFSRTLAGALALPGAAFCRNAPNRLTARPGASVRTSLPAGLHPLKLRRDRDALLYIPESAIQKNARLVVSLHGATRTADRGIDLLRSYSDRHGFLLLAPASEGRTWDAIGGAWGPDVDFINRALARTFQLRSVDGSRIAMAGFSDGASYSLSIGLSNGDLFHAVFGFSPGFVVKEEHTGKPPLFISHGTVDPILPIEECSRLIVPALQREGYLVTYREFEGKHTLPPEVAAEAMNWLMQAPPRALSAPSRSAL